MNGNKTVMDALDAPQWTDFTSSPQVSDDFFNRLHLEHELEYHQKLKQYGISDDKYSEMQLTSTVDVSDFENVLDEVQITPIKVISPKNKNNKDEKIMATKETTVENLLLEAMSNLQLSAKKGQMNQSITNPSVDISKTPKMSNKRITRSMSARLNLECSSSQSSSNCSNQSKQRISKTKAEISNENSSQNVDNNLTHIDTSENFDVNNDDSKHSNSVKKVPSRIVTSFDNQKTFSSTKKKNQPQQLDNCNFKSTITKPSGGQQLLKPQRNTNENNISNKNNLSDENKIIPSRIVTSFSLQSSGSTKSSGAAVKKRPHLLTSIRRQSLIKHKRNNQFVSLAEAVSKFQKGTPKRFRSVSAKDSKPAQSITSKQVALKITRPISPVLTSKTRARPIKALTHEQKENEELDKIRSRPIKAHPVPEVHSFKNSQLKSNKTKNPSTLNESSHLNQSRKVSHFSSFESLSTTYSRQACHSSDSQTVQKKMVHAIVSTEDSNLAVKEVELGHFGIPTEPCDKPKKFTRTLPFSFEIRNKEFQENKERKLKKISEQINKIKMVEFHAKPAPNHVTKELGTSKGKSTPKQNSKELLTSKRTTPCPFSFDERNKLIIKKKEHLIKEAQEKDKQVRKFCANPVPEFRPVIVRGRSRENIRTEEKSPEKQHKINKELPVSKTSFNKENNRPVIQRINSASDIHQEKYNRKVNNKKTSTVLTELNTDKRARNRKQFHEKLKKKEADEEMLRKKEEEERLIREKAEKAELRKMAETKARPMPHYKPISIIKSSKPLTDPQSPAWMRKNKT